MKRTERERRVPRRYIAFAVIVTLVMGSERWNGPFTFRAIQRAGAAAAGVAADDFADDRTIGQIHLTFDDGPSLEWTPEILDVLAAHGALATFFPIGSQVGDVGSETLRRAVAEGHRIGNHTWNHHRLVGIDESAFHDTVGRTQEAILRATGVAPSCLRPPQGVIDEAASELAAGSGLSVEMWTIDPQDWNEPGSGAIVSEVVNRVSAGDVILLHDGGGDRSQTVRALDEILERLGRAGFEFTVLPGC